MYFFCSIIIVIMAGFEDDNDFSFSGLMQQGHELDVTVISSDDEDNNYGGVLECVRQLGGEISKKTTTMYVEGGIQPLVEPLVKSNTSNFLISKSMVTVPITAISMASSVSHSDKSIHVSFIYFNGL